MDEPSPWQVFRKIRTGVVWDECWIWTGYMDGAHPTYLWKNKRLRVRPYIRARFHPAVRYGRQLPRCEHRCVHPDHTLDVVRVREAASEAARKAADPGQRLLAEMHAADNYARGPRHSRPRAR